MSTLDQYFIDKINKRKADGTLRNLTISNNLIDFYSNDYLGLARSAELSDLIAQKYSSISSGFNGSTGSRLLSGNSPYAEQVEERLASIFKAKRALLFNSGYSANIGVISSVPQKGDTILYDELSHASIKDGARLSLATRHSFKHNNLEDLENKIKKASGRVFVVVESVYSMDGDHCPLVELCALKKKYDIVIILDEAHSTGVYGENGSGLACSLNLQDAIDIRIYTFGKAMGVHGACVVGSDHLINYLVNYARPFIYTTAMSPHGIASIDAAFEFISKKPFLQDELQKKIDLFLHHTQGALNATHNKSSIQTVVIGGNEKTKSVANQLQSSGFDVRPILSPTVAKGKERIRICLHTYNTEEEILNLANTLNTINN